jgi:V/A-type H+-transporting ATPase subunit I
MIVRMSKVEIVGPKKLLLQVLSKIRELEVFHIEPDHRSFVEEDKETAVTALSPDQDIISERQLLDDLEMKIDELVACLPKFEVREIYLKVPDIIQSINAVVEKHLDYCGALKRKRDQLREELAELDRHTVFIEALESLFAGAAKPEGIEFVGVTLKDSTAVEHLREMLDKLTNGRFEIFTTTARDSTLAVLLAVQKGMAGKVKDMLSGERIPELVFPRSAAHPGLSEKIDYVRKRMDEISAEKALTENKMEDFARHWLAIYGEARKWICSRHSLLKTTAKLFETGQCFFVYGWMPSEELPALAGELSGTFGGVVVVAEMEIKEQELEKVPVVISNPPYFRPFEMFARLLPLPSYTSFDPTVFIGIFFPIFFGMILGDTGYGLILSAISILLRKMFRSRQLIRDAAAILLVCSVYSIIFGFIFGEFLGELGRDLFGLRPLWVSRTEAVIPMLFFSLSVGVFHVLLGLFLGFLAAVRKRVAREALFKLANIIVILCLVAFFAVRTVHVPPHLNKVLVITLVIIIVTAVFSGGLLAPLELLKSVGNIISYARIMAIGLASVLLASVANVLGGMTGDVVTGILVAVLFHAVNIVLGVFAPTIQSLRLHFVEFFGKFLEHGGRKYEPFK